MHISLLRRHILIEKKSFKNKIKIFARGLIMLGGHGNKQQFKELQQYINQLIKGELRTIIHQHYRQ